MAWLLFRVNRNSLLGLGIASLSIVFVSTSSLGSPFADGMGHVLWMVSIAGLGTLAAWTAGQSHSLLVNGGFPPRQTWLVHTLIVGSFCVLTAIVFGLLMTPFSIHNENLVQYTCTGMLIAFGFGQLASLFSRRIITSLSIAAALGAAVFFLLEISLRAFDSQLATLLIFCALPLGIVCWAIPSKATRGLSMRFWMTIPIVFALAMAPLPFLRIYEIPVVDEKLFASRVAPTTKDSQSDLTQFRQLCDSLVQLDFYSRNLIDSTPISDIRQYEQMIRNKRGAVLIEILDSDCDWKTLLQNGEIKIEDFNRYRNIELELTRRLHGDYASTPFPELNQAILEYSDWSIRPLPLSLLYLWTSHPETKETDVRKLIQHLENEDLLFERLRAFNVANYYSQSATMDLNPLVFPESVVEADRFSFLAGWFPTEVARFRRNLKFHYQQYFEAIETLQKYHQTHDFGYQTIATQYILDEPTDLFESYYRIKWNFYRVDQINTLLLHRRAAALYLALALWKKDHDGQLPTDLSQLTEGYLRRIPVSPYDGKSFQLTLNAEDLLDQTQPHDNIVHQWEFVRLSLGLDENEPVADKPILWLKLPIRASQSRGNTSLKESSIHWILPKG